ncbi:HEPN domain-containing protein [Geoalkalibacter halelectricus]|uniref:HEPN domain-containing protein n=1 Tax=Geoalkalibacter halelectricus TaxID=2847045 RepID=A0ABY5ZKW4_9BACT|nr:HEPN domain-containing protein [Geoalkalibacter halelectricus]MDO3377858.1 HEPN domain-containing protein [Geoalkalibacter halelectricus]UWZ79698.1 HEPN domain-containing protein [Geoalkalibacter halelectricus]
MKRLTEEWLRAAKDDLDVIERILNDEHLAHIVAFHAQQCIEKVFKALLEEHGIEAPRIHNLVTLYGKVEDFVGAVMDLPLLKTLDSLYIEARYPGELGLLPSGRPKLDDARKFQEYASWVFETVSERLR